MLLDEMVSDLCSDVKVSETVGSSWQLRDGLHPANLYV